MTDFWRGAAQAFFWTALAGLITGWFFGATAAWIAVAAILALWLVYHLRQQYKLIAWLSGTEDTRVPDGSGHWYDIYAGLNRLMKRVRRDRADLSERLEWFREAGAAMPDGLVILDSSDRIIWCNPRAEAFFGVRLDRDTGQQITYIMRPPEFAAYLGEQNYSQPLRLQLGVGSDTTLSIQMVPYGEDRTLMLARDVTQFERLETMRRDFIANVSHELRTPLTVVGGFVETLSSLDQPDIKMIRRSLDLMSEQTERMTRLVDDLLILSRIEGSRRPAGEELVDMPNLAQSLIAEASHLSRGRHRVTLERCAPLCVKGSEDELRSAFGNLLSNAVRYTPEGGSISASWSETRDGAEFSVKDNGPGIAAEHIPRLTERFYRVDRSRSRETGGTGLGLAIVKHVVNHHGAQLLIESEVGKGSTFTVRFPRERLCAADAVAA